MTKSSDRSLWIGFDIKGSAQDSACLKPQVLEIWKEDKFKKVAPEAPFHFMSDALVGLACIHLNQHLKNPFTLPKMNYPFCFEAWQALEPHHELFLRSQPRVAALRSQLKEMPDSLLSAFQRNFTNVLDSCLKPWGMDLLGLAPLIDVIDQLESQMDAPLVYNFGVKFSKPLLEKVHYLHSLLFNLRALIALDYNAYVQDPAHEAVKVDSITDYLAKAEYVANDALLYYQFKKLKDRMPEAVANELNNAFKNLSHNGYCLIENLPRPFLNSLNMTALEETLYLVQMDWLLGTEAGLLFRIREEIYGLIEGYDKIFWTDVAGTKNRTPSASLSVCCKLTEFDVFPTSEAA